MRDSLVWLLKKTLIKGDWEEGRKPIWTDMRPLQPIEQHLLLFTFANRQSLRFIFPISFGPNGKIDFHHRNVEQKTGWEVCLNGAQFMNDCSWLTFKIVATIYDILKPILVHNAGTLPFVPPIRNYENDVVIYLFICISDIGQSIHSIINGWYVSGVRVYFFFFIVLWLWNSLIVGSIRILFSVYFRCAINDYCHSLSFIHYGYIRINVHDQVDQCACVCVCFLYYFVLLTLNEIKSKSFFVYKISLSLSSVQTKWNKIWHGNKYTNRSAWNKRAWKNEEWERRRKAKELRNI